MVRAIFVAAILTKEFGALLLLCHCCRFTLSRQTGSTSNQLHAQPVNHHHLASSKRGRGLGVIGQFLELSVYTHRIKGEGEE